MIYIFFDLDGPGSQECKHHRILYCITAGGEKSLGVGFNAECGTCVYPY